MRYILLLLVLLGAQTVDAQSVTFRGTITEYGSGDPLTGATIVDVANSRYAAVAGLDGSFIIRNIPAGTYTFRVSYIGFQSVDIDVQLTGGTVTRDFQMRSQTTELTEILVGGRRMNDTDESARTSERTADNIINVIAARSIEVSPDITVANVVQRVSGISLERSNNGDGQHAIVRGMDKRYNYTLVNGIKIPSPETKNRFVPLDIFPSDLIDRLEVTKSLTPSMEGDAIGGVIDMRMRNAPDRLMFQANLGTGYSQLYTDRDYLGFNAGSTPSQSPRARFGPQHQATVGDFTFNNLDFRDQSAPVNRVMGLAVGNRFFGGRLGAIAAASYQETYRGANGLFFRTDTDRETNGPVYFQVQSRQYSSTQERAGIHIKTDYQFNANHKLDFYNAVISLSDIETRARIDTNLRIGRDGADFLGTGRLGYSNRSRQRDQQIMNSTLQGTHMLMPTLEVQWSAVYSLATFNEPDRAELDFISGIRRDTQGNLVSEPILYDRDLRRRWTNNSDQDYAGYLNTTYYRSVFGTQVQWRAGGMFRLKTRENEFNEYLLRAAPSEQVWDGDVHNSTWQLINPIGTPRDALNYESEETITAAYLQARFQIGRMQILGGARVENTDFSWVTNAPDRTPGRIGSMQYTNVLPSLHLKYMPYDKTNFRFSYFASLSRPNFFEVIPYEIIDEDYREKGNPFLEHTQAHNIDLRFEHFPTPVDQIMVAVFYKNIQNPIEQALLIEAQQIFMQSNNFGTANNFGLEVDYTKYFRNWGVRAFYTFTESRIETSKIFRFRDDNGNFTSRQQQQVRPLQGQSRHIANASLLYKNGRTGTDAQLAAVYTGARISSVSPYYENDIWQRAFTQLDFSFDQRLGFGITLYAKISNILNTPMRADIRRPNEVNPHQVPYVNQTNRVLVREDFYQQVYLVGLRYRL
ncbi:MAG: TonB-dependent receptor [Bacteroidetes bacterium]|nr:TonB-dependent receptor [Bacteroidota bacterium]MCH8525272.1 TonB-dependent receptor [Balneolales bacterium]